jgi:GxxExxY protein
MTKSQIDALSYQVVGAAIEVHKFLGPGLLESTYQKCMQRELLLRGINFQAQRVAKLIYKGEEVQADLKCDLLIENCLVVELKAIDALAPVHHAQLLTYMKLLNAPKGILFNFNCAHLFSEGQKTMVNELYRNLAA